METGNSTPPSEPRYIYDNAWSLARRRLATLESHYDPGTIRNLETLGVTEGWRCLEVGAGGGSIAEWLCARVGSSGRVVAMDLDTRFIDVLDQPNLEVRKQDIATRAVEAAAFDLVHARMLLEHVPGRGEALHHMVAALKPGGWILLEEFDHVTLLPEASADERTVHVWGKFLEAYRRLMAARGGDLDYGRRLFGLLHDHCLTNVSAEGQVKTQLGGDGLSLSFHQIRVALVATGAIEDREMGLVLSLLDDPEFAFLSPLMMAASGQRALA
jgi:SAM-dependent methyltransferase